MTDRPHLVLIDGSSYIYRAYHALPKLSNSKGEPTGATFGFLQMLKKVVREMHAERVAVVFDPPGGSFRNEIYPEYKATRDAMPEDLVAQIQTIKKLVDLWNIPAVEVSGYEADDVIATLAKRSGKKYEVLVITSDKDLYQIVRENVKLVDTMKDRVTDIDAVKERFGAGPEGVVEVLGLAGDKADNVPGVPGIGEKTAKSLVEQFGTIEKVLENIDKISGKKRKENLEKFADQALLSRKLVTLDDNVPLDKTPDDIKLGEPDAVELRKFFREMEFHTLLDLFGPSDEEPAETQISAEYRSVLNEEELAALVEKLEKAEWIAFDTETDSTEPMRANLIGLSFCVDDDEAYYVPVGHRYLGAPKQLDLKTVVGRIGPILRKGPRKLVAQNAKYDLMVLAGHGLEIPTVDFDTMIAGYVINPARRRQNLGVLAKEYLNRNMKTYADLVGKGVKAKAFEEIPVEEARDYSCDDAHVTFQLGRFLDGKLRDEGLWDIFDDIEMPLVPVLMNMEKNGVKVDADMLAAVGDELAEELGDLLRKLHDIAGMPFNPNSPKQLGEVLFDVIGLPVIKKTKTARSTDQDVLEELALQHELPAMVLEYRSLSKLKGTYADSLPKLINPRTGRIHTSFNQTVTSTGRLSSSNPNLQNIPVRSGRGLRIREAFVPEKGMVMVSADYSQIELRILAHLSGDETLLDSFEKGEDIHRRTAAELFGVLSEDVTNDQRRLAKVVIFGIAYGMSPFGLARNLRIPHGEAKEIHDRYFARYPAVKEYMESNVEEAKKNGCVSTLRGRRLFLPEIHSKNVGIRKNAERSAINAPMQGSAADIIKIAMIRAWEHLDKKYPDVRMILQVHDELLFEVPEDKLGNFERDIKKIMEGVEKLKVPLIVDVGHGANWSEAH